MHRAPYRAARGDNHSAPGGPAATGFGESAVEPGQRGLGGTERDELHQRGSVAGDPGRQAATLPRRHEQTTQGSLHNPVARALGRRVEEQIVRTEQRGEGRATTLGYTQRSFGLRGTHTEKVCFLPKVTPL